MVNSMRIRTGAVMLLICLLPMAATGKDETASRLKYKKGPVCMCSGGLKEKDIRDAMQAREKAEKTDSGTIKPYEPFRRGEKKEEDE